MVGVTLILQARPEAVEAMQDFWLRAARRLQAEDPGCLSVRVQRCDMEPARFVVSEVYRSQADLDAHEASSLSSELLPELLGLIAEPPQVIKGPIVA